MEIRRPLAEITPNRAWNCELSHELRSGLYSRRLLGQSYSKIADNEGLRKETAYKAIQRANQRSTVKNNPRSGRPPKHTQAEDKLILRIVREKPTLTYADLIRKSELALSRSTVQRILKKHGILHWRSKKRPALTAEHARTRLEWAIGHQNTDWTRWIFSDECSVELFSGKKRQWAFGYPNEKWTHERIHEYAKSRQPSIMVWACIGVGLENTDLVVMQRDKESPRQGYSSHSYINALEEGLLPVYEGQAFQQDNAPIHTSTHTQAWMAMHTIHLIDEWPPYSPDLNCIEHMWARLKEAVWEIRPNIDSLSQKDALLALEEALPHAWRSIRREVVEGILNSMPARIQAVINAEGWQTKY